MAFYSICICKSSQFFFKTMQFTYRLKFKSRICFISGCNLLSIIKVPIHFQTRVINLHCVYHLVSQWSFSLRSRDYAPVQNDIYVLNIVLGNSIPHYIMLHPLPGLRQITCPKLAHVSSIICFLFLIVWFRLHTIIKTFHMLHPIHVLD